MILPVAPKEFARRKSTGESTEPLQTPQWMANGEEVIPLTRTENLGDR